jgi:protein-disulfide isomerase
MRSAARRVCCIALLLIVLPFVPALAEPSTNQQGLTPEQEQRIQQLIHDYILANPAVIFEALKKQQQAVEAARTLSRTEMILASQQELLADPASPSAGNPKGDVTIVEFFDYRCPYCKAVEPSLEALLKADPKLRIVYKEFPVLGAASVYAAEIALAAQKQGKYSAFHDAMMNTKGNIDEAAVLQVARLTGIDLDKAKSDIKSPEIAATIKQNYELAATLDINGTPGIVIGMDIADGAADLDQLKRMIAAARRQPESAAR